MGFRVTRDRGFLPASIHDGALWVRWRNTIKSIPVGTGEMVFPEQCNLLCDTSIRCYLTNNEYQFILWENGAAIVVHTRSRTLRGNLAVKGFDKLYEPLELGVVGGYLPRGIDGLMILRYATLKEEERLALLYSDDIPFCFCADMESKQMETLNQLCNEWAGQNLLPRFVYWRETGQLWYEEVLGEQRTELKGELFRQSRYSRLGG